MTAHAPPRHHPKGTPPAHAPAQHHTSHGHAHNRTPAKRKPAYAPIPPRKQIPGHLRGGHRVMIQAWTVQLSIVALLGVDGGKITSQGGGWNQVSIPRGDPLTTWAGRSLLTMDLALVLDGWKTQSSVEADIAKLERLATKLPGMETPPSLRLIGAVPHATMRWVIAGLDWGDQLRDFHSGARLRQAVTLHLLEYRDPSAPWASLARASAAASKQPRKYKIKKGDDLKKIAAKLLGKSSLWPEIVKLNKGLRGWKLTAKWVGKTIKIPAETHTKHHKRDQLHKHKHPSTGRDPAAK